MEVWFTLAFGAVLLGAGCAAGALRMGMILDRSVPDDEDRRRRQRRRARVAEASGIAGVIAVAGLWVTTSPGDEWWVLPLALVLIALVVVLFRRLRRRERAAEANAEPSA